jgi:hypothetical protein
MFVNINDAIENTHLLTGGMISIFDVNDFFIGQSSRAIVITYDLSVPKDEPVTGKITGKVNM